MGKIWLYGDDVNTDVIFPGKYTYTVSDPNEMKLHAMEDLDPTFSKTAKEGDVIVAGKNFGCGSSREQAAFALKYTGISLLIAKSFARIFFRNAINAGIPAVEHPDCVDAIRPDSELRFDLSSGVIVVDGKEFRFSPFSKEMMAVLNCGGLVEHVRARLTGDRPPSGPELGSDRGETS